MDPYVSEELLAEFRKSRVIGIFLRIGSTPPLHMWFGVNDVKAGILVKDPDGTIYLGGGRFTKVPEFEVLINGIAERIDFSLSADEQAILDVINHEDFPDLKGAEVDLGVCGIDQYYQIVGHILPLWNGKISFFYERSEGVNAQEVPQRMIGISVGAGNVARKRGAAATWSAAIHRLLHPTDAFFDNMARLARGVQPAWPRR